MKKLCPLFLFVLSFLFIGFASCSGDDETLPAPIVEPEEPYAKLSLEASPASLNLYQWTEIAIAHDYSPTVSHDSVVWNLPGINRYVSKDGSYLIKTSQMFSLPGKYKYSATAYKDGKVLATDTAFIQVSDSKDFLGIYWNDTQNIRKGNAGFHNELEDYSLQQEYNAGENPYSLLSYSYYNPDGPYNDEEYIQAYKASRKLLTDYITELYGKSLYEYKGEDFTQTDLVPEYNKRFKKELNTIYENGTLFYPLIIWETTTSNIAMIAYEAERENPYPYYMIIAEPKK